MNEKRIYMRGNVVSSIVEALDGWTMEDCFSAEFLADCVPWREGAAPGMVYDPETDSFSDPPPPPEPPEPEPSELERLREAVEILTGGKDDELD